MVGPPWERPYCKDSAVRMPHAMGWGGRAKGYKVSISDPAGFAPKPSSPRPSSPSLPPVRRDRWPFCHYLRERGEVREVDVHDVLVDRDPLEEALDDPALLRDVHRLPLVREVPGLAHDVLLHDVP